MPIYSIKIDQSQSLKEPSKICQHYIVLVENPDSLSKLSIKSLSGLGGTGKFALVFGENLNPSMALYKREERANFSCMNVVSCELTYEKYFSKKL